MTTLSQVLISEIIGTGLLTLLGVGVVANILLPKTKGIALDTGRWNLIAWGWGLAVYAGVWAAWRSGAHLNPAVTIGIAVTGQAEFVEGVPVNLTSILVYFAGELIGAFLGAVVAWLAYQRHYAEDLDPVLKRATFATVPEIRNYGWNTVTEVIGTFVLVFVILMLGNSPHELGPLAVALLVVGIGMSLGGPTGYAINPARDLGPRIAHAVLPIRGKGSSDWAYSWVPIVGPLIGGTLGGLLSTIV